MERLVYTPKVEVLIMLDREQRLVDVTDDLVGGSVNRRLNAMSDIQLTLQNKNGRYTVEHVIEPMDRIIVRMSRVGKPFLVFSGFVDDAPYYQIYPGTVTLAASCTLKLLQHTYFDPGLPAVQNFFQMHGWTYNPDTGGLFTGPGGVGNDDLYGNMKDIIKALLNEIANWPEDSITIYDLPSSFLQNISNVMQNTTENAKDIYDSNLKILAKLYGTDAITSSTTASGDFPTTPLPNSGNIAVADVARAALAAGFNGEDAVIAVAIAGMESGYKTNATHDNGSSIDYGLWQINSVHSADPLFAGDMTKAFTPSIAAAYSYKLMTARQASQGFKNRFADWTTYRIVNPDPGGSGFFDWNSASTATKEKWAALTTGAQKAVTVAAVATGVQLPTTAASTTTSTGGANDSPQRASASNTIATKILEIVAAENNKHIVEVGGNNYGAEIKKYQDYVGISQGQPWCAAFASWVYGQAGITTAKSGSVAGLESQGAKVATPQPSDMIHWGDLHVGIVTSVSGLNVSYIAGNQSNGVNPGSAVIGQASGGEPVAPSFIRFAGVGGAYIGTGVTTIGNQDATGLTRGQIAQLGAAAAFFTQQFQSSDTLLANALTGERAIANDIPIIEWIDNLVPSSGRVYCSTPSGSFLSFFPDRWGFFDRTPYFHINDIEIIDLTINRNDTNLTTHVFTSGPQLPDASITVTDRMYSMVASVEDEAFKFFIDAPDLKPLDFLARYGARPYTNDIMNVNNPLLLWMNGWMKFMELWSARFTANGSFTFMPELLPGGLVSFGGRVQMFVESVTHSFDMSSGFTTTAQLSSITPLTDNSQEGKGSLDPVVSTERFSITGSSNGA